MQFKGLKIETENLEINVAKWPETVDIAGVYLAALVRGGYLSAFDLTVKLKTHRQYFISTAHVLGKRFQTMNTSSLYFQDITVKIIKVKI